ncbi:MAG: amino acid ABC transporter permease, partial [Rhodocyclaceae bacterium]|nr:amino acid ABC transporter permease [Rhodocyclaceae bacterium]
MMVHDGKRPAIVEVGDGAAIPSKSDIGLFTA